MRSQFRVGVFQTVVATIVTTVLFAAGAAPALAAGSTGTGASPYVCRVNLPCPPPNVLPRYFPQTGFSINQDPFWNYFQRRGGVTTFGYPISRGFRFLGYTTQLFQRQVMQLWPDGSVHLLNLLDSGLMPYSTFNFSAFPAPDAQVIAGAPNPADSNYAAEALAFVRANAPDSWHGLPVNFARTYFGTVSPLAAFPGQAVTSPQVQALLPLVQLEVWGLPTSAPAYDPTNHGFVYLRFQRGVMMFDTTCTCTQGVLFGDYFKSILEGHGLSADLAQETSGSPYLAQYAPDHTNWVARPAQLPNTDLTNAFTPTPRPLIEAVPGAAPQ